MALVAMMTDKGLLKLAAKAAGYEVSEINQGINLDFEIFKENENYVYCHHKKPWNPITDDGDALRLAVKLLFEIEMTQDCIAVRHSTGVKIFEAFNHDQYTATRRAIVRAAAEIGKRILVSGWRAKMDNQKVVELAQKVLSAAEAKICCV